MLMPREPLRDRLARRMTERKNAAKKNAKKAAPARTRLREDPEAADARTVREELAAVDAHAVQLHKRVDSYPDESDPRRHEYVLELRALAALRRELESDLEYPVRHDRDGRPLTDKQRAYRRARTRELAEQIWAQAERAVSAGDDRRARAYRLDSLRARQLAEHEMKLRPTLRGYTS